MKGREGLAWWLRDELARVHGAAQASPASSSGSSKVGFNVKK